MSTLRYLLAASAGAVAALAASQLAAPDAEWSQPAPAQDDGALMAWSLRHGSGRFELLGGLESGLVPCGLPPDGMLRPAADPMTGAPQRVRHWLKGGPWLYVMELRQGLELGLPPRAVAVAEEGEGCASGRVLVPAETIMSYLYRRTLQEVSEGR